MWWFEVRRSDWKLSIWVGIGSLAGGLCRYLLSVPWLMGVGGVFPWPTLLANMSGCFVIGFWFALATRRAGWSAAPEVQAAVMAGFCGGLTTFSIFSLETLMLVEAGAWEKAVLYLLASVPLWLLATWAGFAVARLRLIK